ncbi:MAG: 50S ribosomal protein L2 [Planctomycetota bacterium]|nr:50S ribosomal protein L2 [Planctomycetota bacterium]
MAIRVYKKTSAGRRNSSVNLHSEVTKFKPEKRLLERNQKTGGRNHHGVITTRHIGGGAKQRYRVIDFRRNRLDEPAKVVGIEYDPNRTANIALLEYPDGERRYIIAPLGVTDGQVLISGSGPVEPKSGNAMPLKSIPAGLDVHCVEIFPGSGGKLCRSAGTYARLTNKEGDWATLVFPSGEIRQVAIDCRATIGQVGNLDHQSVRLGKAGRSRHLGIRPTVRGMAMTHECHPMGGGSGRSKGNRPPAGPTGVLAKGGKTRKPDKASNKRIIRRRFSKRFGQLVV